MSKDLERDTQELSDIQKEREELERQVKAQCHTPHSFICSSSPSLLLGCSQLREVQLAAAHDTHDLPPPSHSPPRVKKQLVAQTNLSCIINRAAQPTTTLSPTPAKPRTKAEVKNQHPPADLLHSVEDIGRKIELYSYKFSTWDVITLVDYSQASGSMHKCKSEGDSSEKWIDLKKKPIRGLAVGG